MVGQIEQQLEDKLKLTYLYIYIYRLQLSRCLMFIYWASRVCVFRHGEGMLQSVLTEMYIIFIYQYVESGNVLARFKVIFASI